MQPYTDDPHLNDYVFEESFVLGFEPGPQAFAIRIEVAPSNTNPRWHPPPPTDAITLWPARLVFSDSSSIDFRPSGVTPARDATGEDDFGSIDRFVIDGDRFFLSGEWGDLTVVGGTARVVRD